MIRADLRDISRAETLRDPLAGRPVARTLPLHGQALPSEPSTGKMLLWSTVAGLIAAAIWHFGDHAIASDAVGQFIAPTAYESDARSIELLLEGVQ